MIVLMAGLPGTGKSALARELAKELAGTVLSKDEIRHTLFEPRDLEYSSQQDDICMEVMLLTATFILRRDGERVVFLDGRTFSRRSQIERVIEVAEQLGQSWRILECVCSEQTAKERLGIQRDHPAGNRDFELYVQVRARFEEIVPPKTLVNTDRPLEECVQQGLTALR